MIGRQKVVGWVLIIVSTTYIVYFLRARLFMPGPIIEKKEWLQLLGALACVMIGTINVRLAAMREQRRRAGSPD